MSAKDTLPPSVIMALGLTGCSLVGPCLSPPMHPCLSVAPYDPCEEANPPPECDEDKNAVDKLMKKVAATVCLSVMPRLEPMPPDEPVDCVASPGHADCPPPEKVKEEVLEREVLPEDVQRKLDE